MLAVKVILLLWWRVRAREVPLSQMKEDEKMDQSGVSDAKPLSVEVSEIVGEIFLLFSFLIFDSFPHPVYKLEHVSSLES